MDPDFFEVPPGFTRASEQVIQAGGGEAERLQHQFLSTEHLLLALLKIGEGVAIKIFQEAGLNLEIVREEVEKLVGPSPDMSRRSPIRYAPRVKSILDAAVQNARELHEAQAGPDHLAVSLLQEQRGVAALVLRNLGLDLERTRQEILKQLG